MLIQCLDVHVDFSVVVGIFIPLLCLAVNYALSKIISTFSNKYPLKCNDLSVLGFNGLFRQRFELLSLSVYLSCLFICRASKIVSSQLLPLLATSRKLCIHVILICCYPFLNKILKSSWQKYGRFQTYILYCLWLQVCKISSAKRF